MNKGNHLQTQHSRLTQRISNLFTQHLQALVFSLGQLWRKPLSSLLTAAVIGIALTLPAGFYVILTNAEKLTQDWDATIEVSAFLKIETTPSAIDNLINELQREELVGAVEHISREQALEEYKALSGFSDVLDMLDDNPLPALLLIDIANEFDHQNKLDVFLQELEQNKLVDSVVLDRQWLQRLQLIIKTLRRGVYIISALLAIGVLLIVGNTIRLNINNNRQEIEITKLFGGTNAFIQRPFLYSGFWYGLVGSSIALIFVSLSLWMLTQPINELANLYTNKIELHYLGAIEALTLIMIGSSLGLIGSWISVEQHIRQIEPQ